jgi:hypothetical protein
MRATVRRPNEREQLCANYLYFLELSVTFRRDETVDCLFGSGTGNTEKQICLSSPPLMDHCLFLFIKELPLVLYSSTISRLVAATVPKYRDIWDPKCREVVDKRVTELIPVGTRPI